MRLQRWYDRLVLQVSFHFVLEHGHEPEFAQLLSKCRAISLLDMHLHALHPSFSHRNDQTSAHFQLIEQGLRNERCPTGHQDTIERCLHGRALEAITVEQGSAVAERGQAGLGVQVKWPMAFNGEQLRPQFDQHSGLIATARADLQHFHTPAQLESRALKSHRVRM
jgi:hypothetical protein